MLRKTLYTLVAALSVTTAANAQAPFLRSPYVPPKTALLTPPKAGPILPKQLQSFAPPVVVPNHYPHHRHYHVQYRLPGWQEETFYSLYEAVNFERYVESLGFQADIVRHGFHFDVRFRMNGWQTYRTVNSDGYAHHLEHWLESLGYQARVVHH
ncbi:MAG: hypothetical protein L0215_25095 [Gemmataceae bacterium]|nr:hypothetical protein [Gemmataceae bacterium]